MRGQYKIKKPGRNIKSIVNFQNFFIIIEYLRRFEHEDDIDDRL